MSTEVKGKVVVDHTMIAYIRSGGIVLLSLNFHAR